jgi:Mrp family chromosome partitioning ATPase
MIVADPGVGKSLLALSLAVAVRSGAPLLDSPCASARVGVLDALYSGTIQASSCVTRCHAARESFTTSR